MPANTNKHSSIYPVILCGGAGTRLWPLSREIYPKQLLPLLSDQSLLQEAATRLTGPQFAKPVIVCNEDHRFIVAEQLRAIGIDPLAIVLEPVGRNTAPAAALAALLVREADPEGLMLIAPSDHAIADKEGFHLAADRAAAAAADGALVTFGVRPDRPETGYGYIQRGTPVNGRPGCHAVTRFVEKPDLETAKSYLEHGRYDWNSGMFLFAANSYLDELGRLHPDMVEKCRAAVGGANKDLDFLRLDRAPFESINGVSIDYAVMEHSQNVVVVPVDIGWSDVGSWAALYDIGAQEAGANVTVGDVTAIDCAGSYIRSDGPLVAALGVKDLVLVATDDVVLAVPRSRAQDVRQLVDALKQDARSETSAHPTVYRPWGYFQSVHQGPRFQVKRISVKPGAALSLQSHEHRAEHWIVVEGQAEVTCGNDTFLLAANESTYIPPRTQHRLVNPGAEPLDLIEVQSGDYLGEDDIIRLEDVYGRQ